MHDIASGAEIPFFCVASLQTAAEQRLGEMFSAHATAALAAWPGSLRYDKEL